MPIRSEHLDEKTLELHALRSPLVNDRQAEIKNHLKHCPWCKALTVDIETYYREVEEIRRPLSASTARALYPVERMIRLRAEGASVLVPSGGSSLPQRVFETLRRHPVRWATGVVAILSLATFGVERALVRDLNVASARPEKEFLVAQNKSGTELWRRHVGFNFDISQAPPYLMNEKDIGNPVVDVDADGKNEVISISGWKGWTRNDRLYDNDVFCLNQDGTERWKFELHRNITIGSTEYSDEYRFYQVMAGDYAKRGSLEVFALAVHIPWFPNVLVRLDARNGDLLGEYWHNGMLPHVTKKDIDSDGVDELFLGGQNNRFGAASIVVLDPRHVDGYAPSPPEFIPRGKNPGTEKYYILLPASDIRPFWADVSNEVNGIHWREGELLEAEVVERAYLPEVLGSGAPVGYGATIYYYFDRSMRCVDVRISDAFAALHARYEALGKLKKIDNTYREKLSRGVRYWNGDRFVPRPAINKHYLELVLK